MEAYAISETKMSDDYSSYSKLASSDRSIFNTVSSSSASDASIMYLLLYSASSGKITISNCKSYLFSGLYKQVLDNNLGVSLAQKSKYLTFTGSPMFQGVMAFDEAK